MLKKVERVDARGPQGKMADLAGADKPQGKMSERASESEYRYSKAKVENNLSTWQYNEQVQRSLQKAQHKIEHLEREQLSSIGKLKDLSTQVEDLSNRIGFQEAAASDLDAFPKLGEPHDSNVVFQDRTDNSGVEPVSFRLVHVGAGTAGAYANNFTVHPGKVFLDDVEITQATPAFTGFYPANFKVEASVYGWIDIDNSVSPAKWTWNVTTSDPLADATPTDHIYVRFWFLTWATDHVSSKSIYKEKDLRAYSDGTIDLNVIAGVSGDLLAWDERLDGSKGLTFQQYTIRVKAATALTSGFIAFHPCADPV